MNLDVLAIRTTTTSRVVLCTLKYMNNEMRVLQFGTIASRIARIIESDFNHSWSCDPIDQHLFGNASNLGIY